jgi:hypothetical protein
MRELARWAKPKRSYRIYLVGGGTAVLEGWRESSIDADLYAQQDDIFRDVQNIKERLNLNIEFARPEDFVPPLAGSENRHVLAETVGRVSFYHYDPYAQLLSKVVRGFARRRRCQIVRRERDGGSGAIQDPRARNPRVCVCEVPETHSRSGSGGCRRLPLEPGVTLATFGNDDVVAGVGRGQVTSNWRSSRRGTSIRGAFWIGRTVSHAVSRTISSPLELAVPPRRREP